FYIFYAIAQYDLTIAKGQIYIFTFLFVGAIGTFLGGPLAYRFGKRTVIILSFVIPAPRALLLPYVCGSLSLLLFAIIGLALMSSFSVAVVYAQKLIPGKVGTMSGLIVGLAFGMGAIGSIVFGSTIDAIGLTSTMMIVALLPLLGLFAFLLPSDAKVRNWYMS